MRYYQDLGLRARILTLPVMLVFVLSLIWRQLGSVSEAVRVLAREGLLWQPPLKVSQQAVSTRLRQIPASLFAQVLEQVLPVMHQRWQERTRPMPPQTQLALRHFKRVVAVDGSTLDGLVKKTGLLREGAEEGPVLGGKMMALLDLASQLPLRIWYSEDSQAHDQQWWPQIIEALEEDSLVLFDLGFVNYARYLELSQNPSPKSFVTRVKRNMVYEKFGVLEEEAGVRSWLVRIGEVTEGTEQFVRLVEVEYEGQTYQYLTNVKDCARLTGLEIAWLYRNRWRIEDAFKTIKRLLGLAFFHGSSLNAIAVQVWASWLLYCVLIDLTDGVAQQAGQPFQQISISIEMVYRGLYHYSQALSRGETRNIYEFLVEEAKLLGIIKRLNKSKTSLRL
jgi:hypothetical protein